MCERHGVTARMSKVVKHGGTIYLSGQVPEDISLVPDIAEQTRSVLHKIDRLLTESGSDRSHILSATIYLKDMAHFSGMNEVWDTWIPQVLFNHITYYITDTLL